MQDETKKTETSAGLALESSVLNPHAKDYLAETAKWGKFLAAIGFLFSGILILSGLGSIFAFKAINEWLGSSGLLVSFATGIINLLFGAICIFPNVNLWQYAEILPKAIQNNDSVHLSLAFQNLKAVFKFWGIMTLILLALYFLLITITLLNTVKASPFQ